MQANKQSYDNNKKNGKPQTSGYISQAIQFTAFWNKIPYYLRNDI